MSVAGHRLRGLIGATCCLVFVTTVSTGAHHGSGPRDWRGWDYKRTIELCGVVTKTEWTNPHVRMYLDVAVEGQNRTAWTLDLSAPNHLLRRGVDRDRFVRAFPPGTRVVVQGFRDWDESRRAGARTVTRVVDGWSVTDSTFTAMPFPEPPALCVSSQR
jgi:hypothetical protein